MAEFLALIFPRVCLVCDALMPARSRGMACPRCWASVPALSSPRCQRCGHPAVTACSWCRNLSPGLAFGRSWTWTSGRAARRMLHSLKYDGWHRTAEEMADRMSRLELPREGDGRLLLVPVPLSEAKRRQRGYNQSERLARALGARLGADVHEGLLRRVRETPTQTRLTPDQRLRNVAGAFRADPEEIARCAGACVVLVDDVVTTGATLNECAGVLARAGAGTIGFVTFGRAPDPRAPIPL